MECRSRDKSLGISNFCTVASRIDIDSKFVKATNSSTDLLKLHYKLVSFEGYTALLNYQSTRDEADEELRFSLRDKYQ
jgi:hypothetical protein